MTHPHRHPRPSEQDFDLRWWLVPLALLLLSVAAWLASPSLDERARAQPAGPAAPPGLPAEFPIGIEATEAPAAVAGLPARQASAAVDEFANNEVEGNPHVPRF
jgi:hypothetical protein